jgi:ABC-2 type transport system ATP-binding protein
MWQIIRDLVADGVTVFLTTQHLDEADELADKIAIMDQGRIVAEGTSAELKRLVPGGHVRLQFSDMSGLAAVAEKLEGFVKDEQALTLQVPSDGSVRSLRTLFDTLDLHAVEVDSMSIHTPDLDDVFLALTGEPTERKDATP